MGIGIFELIIISVLGLGCVGVVVVLIVVALTSTKRNQGGGTHSNLLPCPQCSKPVSPAVTTCPHCGHPLGEKPE